MNDAGVRLIDAWLDARLDAAGAAELRRLLADPAAAAEAAALLRIESGLRGLRAATAAQADAMRPHRRWLVGRLARPVAAAIAVAAALALAIALPRAQPDAAPADARAAARVGGRVALFADGLAGWTTTRGTAETADGAVAIEGGHGVARIESVRRWGDVELRCRLRCRGPGRRAEIQIHRFWRLVAIEWTDDAWKDVVLTARGGRYAATIDGRPVPVVDEDADHGAGAAAGGPIAFFATHDARLEIADARIRELP